MTQNFNHKLDIQIRFKDVDMMGHVNHANYLTYVELARLKYFDDVVGINTDWHLQHGLIMARLEADYQSAIEQDDQVAVYTRCSKLGTKSFDLHWIITKTKNDIEEIAAEGKTTIVCYDYESKKAIPIPTERQIKMQNYDTIKNQ